MNHLFFAAAAAVTIAQFQNAPIGHRLEALRHVPLLIVPVATDVYAVAVWTPEQGTLSHWDDESRIILYRRTAADFERIQFMSKAGKSVPGKLRQLLVRDIDGDGIDEVIALGGPHGPVNKSTIMMFRRDTPDGKFIPVLRRRHAASAVTFGAGGHLVYTYEDPQGVRRFEPFTLRSGWYEADGHSGRPVEDE